MLTLVAVSILVFLLGYWIGHRLGELNQLGCFPEPDVWYGGDGEHCVHMRKINYGARDRCLDCGAQRVHRSVIDISDAGELRHGSGGKK